MSAEARPTVASTLAYVGERPGRAHRVVVSLALGGNRRDVELVATNRQDEPALDGIVLTMRDISERTQFQRQLASLMGAGRERSCTVAAVDVAALVRRVEPMLHKEVEPDCSIVLSIGPALWRARADADDLAQVLVQIARNGRDAMPGGGPLTIGVGNVPAGKLPASTAMPRQDYLRLTIDDSGEGMPADVLARAFEPFFTTRSEGRSGLGLAFVYAAMRRVGGFVDVSSRIGLGTTVTLWLPRADD